MYYMYFFLFYLDKQDRVWYNSIVEKSLVKQDTEAIAQSIIPYPYDDNRAKYLGLRSSGFTPKEATKLLGLTGSALSGWRRDPEFVSLEKRLPEFRKQLALEYASLEFYRVFRLITEKDVRVVKKSLEVEVNEEGNTVSVPMTKEENSYLLKLRSFYTLQQMQVLAALGSGGSAEGFNFTDLIKDMGRKGGLKVTARQETVEISEAD